jgi:hypothetical protein
MEEQLERHIQKRRSEGAEPSEKYIRLTKARIDMEKSRLESKIEEFKKQKDVSIDYNLEGIVYLEVGK